MHESLKTVDSDHQPLVCLPDKFNWEIYLAMNKDLGGVFGFSNREAAEQHYLEHGCRELRPYCFYEVYDFSALPDDFDWKQYQQLNPDLCGPLGDGNRLMFMAHYLKYGREEARYYKYPFDVVQPEHGVFPCGVNVVGLINGTLGLGNSCREFIRHIKTHNIPHVLNEIRADIAKESHFETHAYSLYDTNFICCNPDIPFQTLLGQEYFKGKRNIALWFWELDAVPKPWIGTAAIFDEIWVQSTFCKSILSKALPGKPIRFIPPNIHIPELQDPAASKNFFGLDPHTFMFFFMFDANSDIHRKNPEGLIKAFKLAFPTRKDAGLLIKVNHMKPEAKKWIQEEVGGDSRIKILFEPLSTADRDRLYAACDAYVSLHRSEGLGLTLLEAILMEKPLISTAHPGSMDFCDPDLVDLIPASPIQIHPDSSYRKNFVFEEDTELYWLDPDLHCAAEKMREVFGQPQRKTERVQRLKARIIERWGTLYTDSNFFER